MAQLTADALLVVAGPDAYRSLVDSVALSLLRSASTPVLYQAFRIAANGFRNS